jgi:hypothetical protein
MPKAVTGNAGRKPPEPSVNHGQIDACIKTLVPHIQLNVKALDQSIRATVSGLHDAVKQEWRSRGGPSRAGFMSWLPATWR